MKKEKTWTVLILLFLLIGISILDLLANLVGAVPVLGDVIETLSEAVLESLQIVIASGIGFLALKSKG